MPMLDRDEDGVIDNLDNCPDEFNPVDPSTGEQPMCASGIGGWRYGCNGR